MLPQVPQSGDPLAIVIAELDASKARLEKAAAEWAAKEGVRDKVYGRYVVESDSGSSEV